MKSCGGCTPAVVILISGITMGLINSNKGDNHQRSVDYDNKNSSEPSAKFSDFDDYAYIDLKRLQPQVTTLQDDYYDYSNQDYPNYDHNRNDDHSKPSDHDEYEDPKKDSGRFAAHTLEKSIPGMVGRDYPNYSMMPRTEFDCQDHPNAGLYGDIETGCQMFHICQEDGRHDTFLCPVGTIFNQQHFICDWWFNYNCSETPQFFALNSKFYRNSATRDGNRKNRHSHSHSKHSLKDIIVKQMDYMMQNDKMMNILTSGVDNSRENSYEEKYETSEDSDLPSNQELNSKRDIWEPMRRYRRVKVRKISLHSTQEYDAQKKKYPVDGGQFSVSDVDNFDRKVEGSGKYMTTINYAMKLLHQNLNFPPPSNMNFQPSTTSKMEYATASSLKGNMESYRNFSDTLLEDDMITKSEDTTINVQNKSYLPTLTSKSEDSFAFSRENYPHNTITTTDTAVSANPTSSNASNNDDYQSFNIQNNEDDMRPSGNDDDDQVTKFPIPFESRSNLNSSFKNSVSSERMGSEEPLLDFDYGRRIGLNKNQSSVRRRPSAHRRNPLIRRPGASRLRWRHRQMKRQRKEMKLKPEIVLDSRNVTSVYKVKNYRKRKLSKPRPKVEWMLYSKNETTLGRSWNDFIRQRRTMLKMRRLMTANKDTVHDDFVSSTPSILYKDNYSSTINISTLTSENNYPAEKVAHHITSKNSFDTNQNNHVINEQVNNKPMFNYSEGNYTYIHRAENEENPISERGGGGKPRLPMNITEKQNQQNKRKLSKIRVNRRCKAVCIRLIKNHLPNLDLEETEDGLYSLSTQNDNLQWLNTRRLPTLSSATEFHPQAAESGSVISKEPDCDEGFKDSFRGWSIIIDRGSVTKEKTIKRKCNLKRKLKNGDKNSAFQNSQLSKSSAEKHASGLRHQSDANRWLWPENFRRGIRIPVAYSRGEVLVPSESEVSKQNDQRNVKYTINNNDPRIHRRFNRLTEDKGSRKLPTIGWKQKRLQSQILRASSISASSQNQPSNTGNGEDENPQHPPWEDEFGKNLGSGWSKNREEYFPGRIATRRMKSNIIPFSKIIWPPGARGSKIDWSQNASKKFSNISLLTGNKNLIKMLPNDTITNIDLTSKSSIPSSLSGISGASLSEIQTFLRILSANQHADEKQPALKHKSVTAGNLENKWISNFTDIFENRKNSHLLNPDLTKTENIGDSLFSSSDIPLRNRLGIQYSNKHLLTRNQEEGFLPDASLSSVGIDEMDDVSSEDNLSDNQNFYTSLKSDHESSEESMINSNPDDQMLNVQDFQTAFGSRKPRTLENIYSNNYRSLRSHRLYSQPTQIDWSVYKPINFSLNNNVTSNKKTFKYEEIETIWPRGKQHLQQRDWSSDIQSFISTEVPTYQKGYSRSTQNPALNSNAQNESTLGARTSQKGRSDGRSIPPPGTIGSSKGTTFPIGTQNTLYNQSVNRQPNRNTWSTDEDGPQRRGDQNSMKGRTPGKLPSLKDWLFDTEDNEEVLSSNTQRQGKGTSFQMENPKNLWTSDTQNFHKGTKDSNIRNIDEGKPDDKKSLGDNSPSRRNSADNMPFNVPINNNWSSSVNGGQKKGWPDSNLPPNSWKSSDQVSKQGRQLNHSNPQGVRWPNNQHSEKSWSFKGKNLQNDWSSNVPKDDWSSNVPEDDWSANFPRDDWSSNIPRDDWFSDVPKDDWSSDVPKDDWSSNVPKDDWSSDSPKADWPFNSRQNTKGSPFTSVNSDKKQLSSSGRSKHDESVDQRLSQADISKIIEELKLSLKNLKIPSRTQDMRSPNINRPHSRKGNNKGRVPQFPTEYTHRKSNGMMQPGNPKGSTNIENSKNSTMEKKIRWSVQIDGNGRPKSGWLPITLRPMLDVSKNPKDNESTSKGDGDWSSWGHEPSLEDNESQMDDTDISETIDPQESKHKFLWLPPTDLNLQSSENLLKNASYLPSFLLQPNTEQVWSAQFDGSSIPASGWLPINIRNVSLTRNITTTDIPDTKPKSLQLEESKTLKTKPEYRLAPHEHGTKLAIHEIIVNTDVTPKIIEVNQTESNRNQKQIIIQNSPENFSPQSPNTSITGITSNNNNNQSTPSVHSTNPMSSADTTSLFRKIPSTTTTPPIVSTELQTKFMQVGRNETLRILPFSLIHKQLNRTSKKRNLFKGSHFKTEILKSTVSVKPEILEFQLENLFRPNVIKSKELNFTTFTLADGRLHPPRSRSSSHVHPSVNKDGNPYSNHSNIIQLPQAFSHNIAASSNRTATNTSIDNEQQQQAIVTGNVHKL